MSLSFGRHKKPSHDLDPCCVDAGEAWVGGGKRVVAEF